MNQAYSGENGVENAWNGSGEGGGPYILKGEDTMETLSRANRYVLEFSFLQVA